MRGRVKHRVKESVNGMIHTSSLDSIWAMFRRADACVYDHAIRKLLGPYSNEFAGRRNIRQMDTEWQMTSPVQGGIGMLSRFTDLIGPEPNRQPAMLNPWNAWE